MSDAGTGADAPLRMFRTRPSWIRPPRSKSVSHTEFAPAPTTATVTRFRSGTPSYTPSASASDQSNVSNRKLVGSGYAVALYANATFAKSAVFQYGRKFADCRSTPVAS